MSQKYNVSVVIPVLGNWQYTETCLRSLFQKSKCVDEVIIIDNENPSTTAEKLKESFSVNVYIPKENLGVATSWDVGIKMASNNIVCVSNNDVEFVDEGWDEKILDQWKTLPDAAIMSPWPVGSLEQQTYPDHEPFSGLAGCCFFIKKDLLEKTDNWQTKRQYIDRGYKKAYWEDVDILTQVRNAGMDGYVTQITKIIHFENKTAGPLLPSGKTADNPYWQNLEYLNKKYEVYIWDFFKVFNSNVVDENTGERLI